MQRKVVTAQPQQQQVKTQMHFFAIIARFQKIDAKETEKHVNDAFAGVDDIHEVYTTNSRSPQELTQAASKTQTRKPQSKKL